MGILEASWRYVLKKYHSILYIILDTQRKCNIQIILVETCNLERYQKEKYYKQLKEEDAEIEKLHENESQLHIASRCSIWNPQERTFGISTFALADLLRWSKTEKVITSSSNLASKSISFVNLYIDYVVRAKKLFSRFYLKPERRMSQGNLIT
ncbi:MAG: hypothetical protein EZS28_004400 [Streblomastix strix]|uniref:Uncharacterized protein n=1 Tax=Streblomastix strix TaxID=222440 RepID=A0A5J4WY99_9EUKA|nr:MAG: hypothetical protein EZS28_004400 [Streblomastix strix]